jgi:F-type H+-transporting ATPase subunit a
MSISIQLAPMIEGFPALALQTLASTLASGGNPLDHVLDKPSALGGPLGIQNLMLSVVSVVSAGIVAFAVLFMASRSIATGPASAGTSRYLTKGRIAQLIEVIVQSLRDGVLYPLLGKDTANFYLPFLLSLFFFVLTLNLFGFVPFGDAQELMHKMMGDGHHGAELGAEHGAASVVFFGGAATASISVTAGLAFISFAAIIFQAFRDLGVKGFFEHMCGGKQLLTGPKGLLLVVPVIFIVEVLGLIIKPSALAIRLFANMLAGHTLLATIFMFTGMALKAGGWGLAAPIGIVAAAFALAISFLELFVAFLQAFVFMFLTAVFMGMMSHHGDHAHDGHGGHGDGHGDGHDAHAGLHAGSHASAAVKVQAAH